MITQDLNLRRWAGCALVGALLTVASAASQAAEVTLLGDDVSFTYDDSSLFGSATVVGNSIFFSPTAFLAEANNADGVVFTTDTLNITVSALDSNAGITSFQLAESGDYLLTGDSSSVYASGWLQVTSTTQLDGALPFNASETFDAGTLDTAGTLSSWSAGTTIDLAAINGWGSDTQTLVQLQNNLQAISLAQGDSAMVQKKFDGVGLTVEVSEVPAPAALWLFGSALIALGGLRRR